MKLKMKPYIKPFEKILGIMELKSLAGIEDIDFCEDGTYDLDISISDTALIRSLAYWETVGDSSVHATVQVMMESTYNGERQSERSLCDESGINLRKTRILRYGLHDIHEYKGKFFPQLVRACINISGIAQDSLVLDPFCGSGTTLCEARVRGMKSVGIDFNPLSVLITKVKAGILGINKNEILMQYEKLKRNINYENVDYTNRWDKEDLEYLAGWFAEDALIDIHIILNAVSTLENEIIADLFRINLSNIIRELSWQKESDLRVRKEVGVYIKGTAMKRFKQEAEKQFSRMFGYLDYIQNFHLPNSRVIEGNTVNAAYIAGEYKEKCDVMITSPPYATALPYLDTDRLSIIILGLMKRKEFPARNTDMVGNREITEKRRMELWRTYQNRKSELTDEICSLIDKIAEINHKPEIGFRRRNLPALLAKYFLDMLDSMKAARELLKPGAMAFYVVGNNSTKLGEEKIIIETNLLLWNLSEKAGWIKEAYLDMDMLKATLGYDNNRSTAEAIMIFRKERDI